MVRYVRAKRLLARASRSGGVSGVHDGGQGGQDRRVPQVPRRDLARRRRGPARRGRDVRDRGVARRCKRAAVRSPSRQLTIFRVPDTRRLFMYITTAGDTVMGVRRRRPRVRGARDACSTVGGDGAREPLPREREVQRVGGDDGRGLPRRRPRPGRVSMWRDARVPAGRLDDARRGPLVGHDVGQRPRALAMSSRGRFCVTRRRGGLFSS